MKNKITWAGIIALAAFIGFTLISCKDTLNDKTVDDPQLERIAVTTPPTKNQYSLNESLNITGMVVTAYYSDGSSEAVTDYDISDFDSSTAGSKTVTVSYNGKTDTFTVMVNAPGKTLERIAVTTPPTKTQYNIGESLSTAGMVVTATFSDNSTAAVTGYDISGFSSSTAGSKTVTVSYGGKTANFTVTVVNPNPTVTPVTAWKGLTVPSATTANQHSSYQGKTDVLHIAPATTYNWAPLTYSLADYAGKEITIDVSMQVWLDVSTKVAWQVNVSSSDFPVIAGNTSTPLSTGQWHTVSGTKTITPGTGNDLYLSGQQLDNKELYITGFAVNITIAGNPSEPVAPTDPRIKDPATQNTKLTTSALTVTTTSGGNKPLTGSPYGYETWLDAGGGGGKLIWFGANQGGGAAFRSEWTNPDDWLCRIGYFWNENKSYTAYGNVFCGFNYTRSGRSTAGNYSYIGIYGWSRNPSASVQAERLIEYYIVEDWFGNQYQSDDSPMGTGTTGGTVKGTYTLDGATYQVIQNTRLNKPSIEGDKDFVQFFSIRQTPRKSGTISITEHFKKWQALGMNLGSNMYECKFLVEAGGGTGWFDASFIQFYRANNDGTIIEITP